MWIQKRIQLSAVRIVITVIILLMERTSSKTNLACEKLLGVILDDNLNLKSHISNICKKASNKLNAFACISSFIYLPKCRVIMKTSLIHNLVSVR